jgi:hypothetical protein
MLSIASFLRFLCAAFKAEGSPAYRAMEQAVKNLEAGKAKEASAQAKAARDVIEHNRPKDPQYFNVFIESLGKLNPDGRRKMSEMINSALDVVPPGTEWRKPFEAARKALTDGEFGVEGAMPDLYAGAVAHLDEAVKHADKGDAKKAQENVQFAMNLYRACTPLIARNQMMPLP